MLLYSDIESFQKQTSGLLYLTALSKCPEPSRVWAARRWARWWWASTGTSTTTLCISENPGCHFIATNLDAKTHLTDAQEWAGNGAMVGAIKGKLQALQHSAYHFESALCALPIRGSSQPGGRH